MNQAPSILRKLKLCGITLSLVDDKIVAHPASLLTDAHRTLIREHKSELVSTLSVATYHILVDDDAVASDTDKANAVRLYESTVKRVPRDRAEANGTVSVYLIDSTGTTLRVAHFPPFRRGGGKGA